MIKETFQPFETKTGLPVTGQYIFIEKCPNPYILVRARTASGEREYALKERETNYVPVGEEFTELTVENNGEQLGEVIIRTGFGQFTQSNDRQRVLVDNEINLPSTINFANPQPIFPSSTAVFKTMVQNWPTEYLVTFKGAQPVHFESAQPVTIENAAPVAVEGTVDVDDSTPLKVNVQNAPHEPKIYALADLAFDGVNAKVIAAKPTRKGLILQAPETNQAVIVVQGFLRVQPGAVVPFPASNAVTFDGASGDALYVGEEI